jgi:transketolase
MFEIQPPDRVRAASAATTGEVPTSAEAMRSVRHGEPAADGPAGDAQGLRRRAPRARQGHAQGRRARLRRQQLDLQPRCSSRTPTRDRFIECKIGEQNMFSRRGRPERGRQDPVLRPPSAKFITRAYDQIEMAINSGANLKIVGSHAGMTLAADGPSQMSLPDVAWFRAFTTIEGPPRQPGVLRAPAQPTPTRPTRSRR